MMKRSRTIKFVRTRIFDTRAKEANKYVYTFNEGLPFFIYQKA